LRLDEPSEFHENLAAQGLKPWDDIVVTGTQ
jgi:hypothetical protein